MKKNKMMRLASAMMVLTLMSTSVISGTFAKYVTTNSGSDVARVAKWGVEISVADDMGIFATSYATDDETSEYTGALSVESSATVSAANGNVERVVAPGTSGSMTFSVTGQPEVAVELAVTVDVEDTICLEPSTYTLTAGKFAGKDTSVTTTVAYEPIKFYLGDKDAATLLPTDYTLTLAGLESALEDWSKTYAPNTNLGTEIGTYTLAWSWAFEADDPTGATWSEKPYDAAKIADFLDTYLGDEGTLQQEKFKVSITVTQID